MHFNDPRAHDALLNMDAEALDKLEFGVVGLDSQHITVFYNRHESRLSGLSPERVLGKHFFSEVAPCTNNYLVALRYEEEDELDECVDYVFTLRMKPRAVELRLLKNGAGKTQYLLVRER
jgi:photoactive yellow protein